MKRVSREFLRWIPGYPVGSRGGISLIFSAFFYFYGVTLLFRAGAVSRLWQHGTIADRVDIAAICATLLALYTAACVPSVWGRRGDRRRGAFSRRFRANTMAVVGLVLLLFIIFAAVLAPVISSFDPVSQVKPALERYLPPSLVHPMGTDKFGRDVLSRVLHGARVSLAVGIISVLIAALLGTAIGALSGYLGGWIDGIVMRVVDGLLAFPRLLIVLTLVALFSNSFALIITVISGTAWMGIARLVRAEVLSLKRTEFVEAALATGAGRARIIAKHLVPNSIGPVLVAATLKIGSIILLESSLSFLGLGIQPPAPSWGGMVFEGREVLLSAWWVAAFPALAIVLVVVSCNLLGDGLRDAMDVRTPA